MFKSRLALTDPAEAAVVDQIAVRVKSSKIQRTI
jgi:hypothetical protein